MRIDRVYDTYADDVTFTKADEFVENVGDSLQRGSNSSRELFQMMGDRIRDDYGILATAAKERLPIFCPALADSSIGMALTIYRNEKLKKNAPPAVYDALMDNIEIMGLKRQFPKSGVIFIGGGTPQNYIQQGVAVAEVSRWAGPPHHHPMQGTPHDSEVGGLFGRERPRNHAWGKIRPT